MMTRPDYTEILTYHCKPAHNITYSSTTQITGWKSPINLTVILRVCEGYGRPVFLLVTDTGRNDMTVLLKCHDYDVTVLAEWDCIDDEPLPIVEAAELIAAYS